MENSEAQDAQDWDVDQYKTDYECDEHWDLRRNFMLAHKDKFSEDELVCLAQVFVNTELLGCRWVLVSFIELKCINV